MGCGTDCGVVGDGEKSMMRVIPVGSRHPFLVRVLERLADVQEVPLRRAYMNHMGLLSRVRCATPWGGAAGDVLGGVGRWK